MHLWLLKGISVFRAHPNLQTGERTGGSNSLLRQANSLHQVAEFWFGAQGIERW